MRYFKKLFLLLPIFIFLLVSCGTSSSHTHQYSDEWTIDVEPTCTEAGSKSHHCLDCDEKTDVTSIPALGHTFGEWTIDVEPTCTEAGSKSHHCSKCNEKTAVSISATGHTFGKWTTTKEPTETTEGSKERECSVCHTKETETIPLLTHTHHFSDEWTVDVEPTCTEAGSKSHHCSGCKEKTDVTGIPALGHTFGEWATTKEPTETSEGSKERECSVCHIKETETLPILKPTEGLSFELNSNKTSYSVTGMGTATDIDIIIPSSYNNLPVTSIGSYSFYGSLKLKSITIPNSVTSIGESAFYDCSSLTSITIPNNVTSIDPYAFYNCNKIANVYYNGTLTEWCKLNWSIFESSSSSSNHFYMRNSSNVWEEVTSIEIPNTITEIVANQFSRFNNVTSITIPNSVTTIGESAFAGCNNLISITIPKSVRSIGNNAFKDCSNLSNVYFAGTIADWCNGPYTGDMLFNASNSNHFYLKNSNNEWEKVISIEIPNTIREIVDGKFSKFNNVASITIPNSVTSIGSNAFYDCYRLVEIYNLSSLNIVKGGTSNGNIGYYAQIIHKSLKEGRNIIKKDNYVFYKDDKYHLVGYYGTVTDLVLPNDIGGNSYEINNYAFWGCSSLRSVTIPDSITSIGDSAFSGCIGLASVTIGNSNISIGKSAFEGCSNVEKATIPTIAISFIPKDKLREVVITGGENIGIFAFYNCSSLRSVTIPDSITSIGDSAFYNCSSLRSVTIPDSITSIGYNAFYNCSSLTSITIGKSVKSVGENAFKDCSSITSIAIPDSVTSIGNGTFENCSSLVYNKYDNGYYLGNKENPYVVLVKAKSKNITGCEINSSTKVIYSYAFSGCSSLTSITIPNSVKSIGYNAFSGCSSLTSILIPNSVTSIGSSAFSGCIGLASVTIGNSNISIGKSAFEGCSNVEKATIPTIAISSITKSKLKEVVITGGKSIEDDAFYNCNSLTSITIPISVTNIGKYAFSGCSSLTNVYYEGIIENWCNITVSSNPMSPVEHFYIRNSNNEWEEVISIEIPNTITEIGAYQFYGFNNVTSITIPNSVTSIGKSAFEGCSNVEKATIPTIAISSIPNSKLKEVVITGGTSIGKSAFSGCNNLTSITLPFVGASLSGTENTHFGYIFGASSSSDNLNYIPTSLKEVIITSGTGIGPYAFCYCRGLTSIVIPNSVTSIGKYAFSGCSSLTNVYYEGTIEDWCNITFNSDDSNPMYYASHFYLRNSNNEWEEVTSIEIPNTITEIGAYQFYEFNNVKSIIIPNSVTRIKGDPFRNCSSLTNIYYEGTIEDWCNIKFDSYESNPMVYANHFYLRNNNKWKEVTSIGIPNTITEIGAYQFYGFNNVTSITIPNSVTSIGTSAFSGCYKLVEVYNLSSLDVIIGSEDNGYIGYYAKKIHTSLDEKSNLIERENYVFIKDNQNKYYLVAYKGTETDLTLPSDIEGNKYEINIGAFLECSNLTGVVIPDSVTSIGYKAFSGCSNLTGVVIPDSVTSIGYEAFSGCSSLISVTIGNSVKSIGSSAFSDCSKLVEVYNLSSLYITKGSETHGYVGYYAKVIHTSLEESTIITRDNYLFIKDNENKWYLVEYNGTATDLVLPNDIGGNTYEINHHSFYLCSSLTSITIPDSVTSIGYLAFSGCSNLTSITIGNSVTSIGNSAFEGCSSLTSITIPDSVTSIGVRAFYKCSSLTSITLPFVGASLNESENTHFGYIFGASEYRYNSSYVPSSLKEVIITGGTSIGDDAFYNCSSLTSITIPNSVTSIGSSAFYNCSSLVFNEYDNGYYLGNKENPYVVLVKEKSAYITGCEINRSTKVIYSSAFSGCSRLTSVTMGNSVISIGSSAFSAGCVSLEKVYYEGTIEDWCNIKFDSYESNPMVYANHFYLRNNNKWKEVTSIGIPNTITEIGAYQFYGFNNVTSITVPDSVTSIGYSAFEDCSSLTSITIPNSVKSIGAAAFSGCTGLISVSLPNGMETIGKSAFYDCSSLTSITIPESVTSIGEYAFRYCSSLTSITIPDSVTSIGEYAFDGCRSLKEVYYKGTSTGWSKLSIKSNNTYLEFASRYYYSESKPTTSGNYWHYVNGVPTKW